MFRRSGLEVERQYYIIKLMMPACKPFMTRLCIELCLRAVRPFEAPDGHGRFVSRGCKHHDETPCRYFDTMSLITETEDAKPQRKLRN